MTVIATDAWAPALAAVMSILVCTGLVAAPAALVTREADT
jgi:hypothetical protein